MHWKNSLIVLMTTVTLLFVSWRQGYGEQGYITDSFEVTLRTGPSNENRIIAMPLSGQPLEILETEGDWTHVQWTRSGSSPIEGWLLNRYIIRRIPWEAQAKVLRDENQALKEKLSRLQEENKNVVQAEEGLAKALKERDQRIARLTAEYDSLKRASAEFLSLKTLYRSAQMRMETAENNVKTLSAEIEVLRASQRNRWFAIGALILLCGLMIGLVMGRQQRKRRTYY